MTPLDFLVFLPGKQHGWLQGAYHYQVPFSPHSPVMTMISVISAAYMAINISQITAILLMLWTNMLQLTWRLLQKACITTTQCKLALDSNMLAQPLGNPLHKAKRMVQWTTDSGMHILHRWLDVTLLVLTPAWWSWTLCLTAPSCSMATSAHRYSVPILDFTSLTYKDKMWGPCCTVSHDPAWGHPSPNCHRWH